MTVEWFIVPVQTTDEPVQTTCRAILKQGCKRNDQLTFFRRCWLQQQTMHKWSLKPCPCHVICTDTQRAKVGFFDKVRSGNFVRRTTFNRSKCCALHEWPQ
jgi:hypothetical protein